MNPAMLVTYVAALLADNWGWALLGWVVLSVVVVAAVCRAIHKSKRSDGIFIA